MQTDSHPIEIRRAALDDARVLTNVINAAFSVERFFVLGERITVSAIESLLEKGLFLIAETAGRMLGCVYLEPKDERAYLGLLSVDPLSQKLGIGRRLMDEAEKCARSAGCKFVDLKIVNLRAELSGFYRSLGYEETGAADFPREVPTKIPCHFILMSKVFA